MNEAYKALALCQAEFPPITKDKEAQIGTRKYKYADLADILKAVLPILRAHGFLLTQGGSVKDGKQALTTVLCHSSGERITSDFLLPETDDPQRAGAIQTYFRRYALCAILGIVAEDDVDGATGPAKASGSVSAPLSGSSAKATQGQLQNGPKVPERSSSSSPSSSKPVPKNGNNNLPPTPKGPVVAAPGFRVPMGKIGGKNAGKLFTEVGPKVLAAQRNYWVERLQSENKEPSGILATYLEEINQFLGQ